MRWHEYWQGRVHGGHRSSAREFLALEAAEKIFHLDGGETLLDFGCGAGELLEFYVAHYRATGVDFSASMLDSARSRFAEAGLAEPSLLLADDVTVWTDLPDQSYDRITATAVVQYLDQTRLAAFLDSAGRRLSSGGRIVLFDVIDPRSLYLYERGALTMDAAMPTTPLLLKRSAGLAGRRLVRRLKQQPVREIGLAHAPELLRDIGKDAGFAECRVVRSMYYEYRYHVIYRAMSVDANSAPTS